MGDSKPPKLQPVGMPLILLQLLVATAGAQAAAAENHTAMHRSGSVRSSARCDYGNVASWAPSIRALFISRNSQRVLERLILFQIINASCAVRTSPKRLVVLSHFDCRVAIAYKILLLWK